MFPTEILQTVFSASALMLLTVFLLSAKNYLKRKY